MQSYKPDWHYLSGLKRIVIAILILASTTSSYSITPRQPGPDEIKASIFRNTELAMEAAKKAKAELLTPKMFKEAMESYRKADAEYEKGKSLDEIRKNLNSAASLFAKAKEATKLAMVVLGATIQARADAISAEAPKLALEHMREAEKKFIDAAGTLEGGDAKGAQKKSDEAERLFRQAELQAIKVNYLNEAYSLLKEADRIKAKDYAPKTLDKAQNLVKAAEQELSDNRYDTDVARVLARQAKREASHTVYLAKAIKSIRDSNQSHEDLILDAEKPLRRIATSLDLIATFDKGYDPAAKEIISNITENLAALAKLEAKSFDDLSRISLLLQRNSELESRNKNLTTQLGGVEQEKSALAKRLEAQARIRELYDAVEKLFTREEAIFIREGNDVVLRLVGLSFPVGKATIETKYHDFLSKIQKAIATFPNANVTVEGHTDSYGSDATNLKLSVERATAVRQYLMSQMNLDPNKIDAVGFGESRPIATNETDEGRARNRRIEIIIQPKIEESF